MAWRASLLLDMGQTDHNRHSKMSSFGSERMPSTELPSILARDLWFAQWCSTRAQEHCTGQLRKRQWAKGTLGLTQESGEGAKALKSLFSFHTTEGGGQIQKNRDPGDGRVQGHGQGVPQKGLNIILNGMGGC